MNSSNIMKRGAVFEFLLWLVLAGALCLVGAGIPVHFRAVAPAVLSEAGRDTESLETLSAYYINLGQVGPGSMLWAVDDRLPVSEADRDRLLHLLEENPQYRLSGGPAPYFEEFLRMSGEEPQAGDRRKVIELLIPSENREHLLRYLRQSSNAAVAAIMDTRAITGTTRFMPVATSAGQPLDAVILMTALLAQGNYLAPQFLQELLPLVSRATVGERPAISQLERLYFGFLALGKRFDWRQLTELTRHCHDFYTLERLGALLQVRPDSQPMLFAAIVLADAAAGITRYLQKHEESGWEALEYAVGHGRGAVQALLRKDKPLYRPSALVRKIEPILERVQRAPLLSFTNRHMQAALNLKFLVFLAAGYALALSFRSLLESVRRSPMLSRKQPVIILGNIIAAFIFTTVLWVLLEPTLMEFEDRPIALLRLDFELVSNLDSLKTQSHAPAMLDQVTTIILLLFFLIQLMVYVFGLIKLTEIKKQENRAGLKIRLLENEENLFDLGLYIGLSGTVIALILLTLNIVQASLIAAYASTLFGIIFVAILKVCHVRPYRRSLILKEEADSHGPVDHPDNL